MGSDTTVQETAAKTESGVCFRLIYRSHSLLAPTDESGLADILKVARSKNADLGVTGALMLYDDWFAQVLEGPQPVIEALYARIKTDPRHNGVRLDKAGQMAHSLPLPGRPYRSRIR